jgi:hypothetical protein
MKALERQHSLDAPGVEPRVQIQLPEPERVNLVLRLPIPARRRGRLEQELIRRYLVILEQLTAADKVTAANEGETEKVADSGGQQGVTVEPVVSAQFEAQAAG